MQSDKPIEISPESWKEASIHSIKLAQTIIERSNQGIDGTRRTDPLPLLRDACVKASNERIHAHVRATRVVVMKLRKSLLATNEEIKSLNRGKEALEKALEHKRKDLELNHQSEGVRSCRPPREKVAIWVGTVACERANQQVRGWGWGWYGIYIYIAL